MGLDRVFEAEKVVVLEQGPAQPVVVQTLTEADPILWDVALGTTGLLTLTGSHQLALPSNLYDECRLLLLVTQGGGGALTFASGFRFSPALPAPTVSLTVGKKDRLGFMYDAAAAKLDLVALVQGY